MSKPVKQRLAVFLDGTWNTEDDSTNVLHAYHSTKEGLIEENGELILQKRYYDRGVGTTVSDNVRGGGYGLGLEENVREAYNWLVDNYNDNSGDLDISREYCFTCEGTEEEKKEKIKAQNAIRARAATKADEIYIFGFSRGAYTARSLVGLIATCGLVKRGSPITVHQLWNGYAFISKNRSQKEEWWEKELGKVENKHLFGRISSYKYRENRCQLYNETEELLNVWSRRVKITYLGIYDTVGAIGIHALGIPGLKSKLDAGHNTNPTSIITRCRHALAINEQRPSFRLTPILNWVKNDNTRKDQQGNTITEGISQYDDNIRQMWFMGVHSNIGGGYPNNNLSMKPLKWIMDGANDGRKTHLDNISLHHPSSEIPAEKPDRTDIRDSFAEMAGGIYPHILRSKRYYRPIGRSDVVRAGYSLRSVNEGIHESVFELASSPASQSYAPPNLKAFLLNNPDYATNKEPEVQKTIDNIKNQKSQISWPGEMINYTNQKIGFKAWLKPRIILIFWSLFASLGIIRMTQFFWIESVTPGLYTFAVLAGLFILIDWAEHKVTLSKIRYPDAIRLEVYWNILYWFRLLAIPASIIGFICFVTLCIYGHFDFNFSLVGVVAYLKLILKKLLLTQFHYALGAVLGITLLLYWLDKGGLPRITKDKVSINPRHLKAESYESTSGNKASEKPKKNLGAQLFSDLFITIILILILIVVYNYCNINMDKTQNYNLPGGVLLILLLGFASQHIIKWVGKPMGPEEANMGSILQLQSSVTKSQITDLFNSWVDQFYRRWITDHDNQIMENETEIIGDDSNEKDGTSQQILPNHDKKKVLAWMAVRQVLRKAIWRDIIGFVPLYGFIMAVILCIGQTLFWEGPLGDHPLWLYLILFTVICDQIENGFELAHIGNHPIGGSNPLTIGLGAFFTFLKSVGFIASILLTLFTVGTLLIVNLQNGDGALWLFSAILSYLVIGITAINLLFK